jgi:hypothetical protein
MIAHGADVRPAVLVTLGGRAWFDLMFDVQTRTRVENPLPPELLASISAYYRRVTADAYPMNRLVALIMVLTLLAIGAEIVERANPWSIGSNGVRWHWPPCSRTSLRPDTSSA